MSKGNASNTRHSPLVCTAVQSVWFAVASCNLEVPKRHHRARSLYAER